MKNHLVFNYSLIIIFCIATSCSNMKSYQNLGFGGINGTQKAQSVNQAQESFRESKFFKISENGHTLPEKMNTIKTQLNVVNHHKNSIPALKIFRFKQIKPNVNSTINSPEKPQENIHPNIEKSYHAAVKSNSETGQKIGLWFLLILGFPIALIGFIVTLVGLTDNILGGATTANAGFIIFVIGSFMLWRAYKIYKKLKNRNNAD